MRYLNGLEIKEDELTALERMTLFDEGKEIDRIPCCPDMGETMAPLLNIPLREYYHSAEKICELEVYLHETFHSDEAGISITLRGMAEAMGTVFSYPENNFSQLEKPAFDNLNDIDGAKLIHVDTDGKLSIVLNALAMMKKKIGAEVPVSCMVPGAFTTEAMFLGTEKLMTGMLKKPDKIRHLLEIIVENNNRYIQRLIDLEVGIGFADPVSSAGLIGVKKFKEFSLPYLQKNIDFIKQQGGSCSMHICGKSKPVWELLNETGIGAFSIDNIEDLTEAKEILGPHMCIMGNVPPVEVMKNGTPTDVLYSVRECIRKAYDSPNGFILTTGCQLPMYTPAENIQAMMDAARIYGRYPIQEELLFEP